jgi:phage gp46-like protein
MQDLSLNNNGSYLDISFTNGDFTLTKGLDTAIMMSLLVDKRAASFEVAEISRRRGWFGNKLGNFVNYEIGSKLWLLDQTRATTNTLNYAKTYSYDCLQWLLQDNIADRINVDAIYDNGSLKVIISIYKDQNLLYNKGVYLWKQTPDFSVKT